MGQGMSLQKCDGCEQTTPFFGEMYGRMSEEAHGAPSSGMGHNIVGDVDAENLKKEFSEFNTFKNKLLIPFYGTVLAIRVLAAAIMKDIWKWKSLGLSFNLVKYINNNNEFLHLFRLRIVVALIPGLGTVINGALDIIAQIGMQYKAKGTSSISSSSINKCTI